LCRQPFDRARVESKHFHGRLHEQQIRQHGRQREDLQRNNETRLPAVHIPTRSRTRVQTPQQDPERFRMRDLFAEQ